MTVYKDKNGDFHDDMGGAATLFFPPDLAPFTALTAAELAAIDAVTAAHAAQLAIDAVKFEAERRIAAGVVLSSGIRFKCDAVSVGRLTGMIESTIWPKTFKTEAGVTVTLTSQAEAAAVFAECDAYITNVLAASAALQDNPPANPAEDIHWPGDGGAS